MECANRTFDGGEPAGYIDPDAFLKQNGNDAFGVFYIGGLGDDTTAWIENGTLLDALGNIDDNLTGMSLEHQKQLDIIFFKESLMFAVETQAIGIHLVVVWMKVAPRLAMLLSEWEVINCANADPNGSNYPEPETQDAAADMQVVCGGHQYLCLDAPNSPPGEFALESPVTNSLLNVNSDNLSESLSIGWSESYDSDGHDLHYTFVLYTTFPNQDTLFSSSTVNELGLSISYQSIYDLLGPNNSLNCYWDVFVTDLYDTTLTNNGPYFLQLSSDAEGGLNQPPTEFNLEPR